MSALFIVLLFLAGLAGLIALMARLEPVLEPAPVQATSAPGRLSDDRS
jgi:hypothetical protein